MSDTMKILQSERLTDNPDGGGRMTSVEVVDGVVNNLFPNISRVDRTLGVVELRKTFLKADSPDTQEYNGVHIIIDQEPADPRVTVTMFGTNSWADERSDAQAAIESYLIESVPTDMIPFDRQLAGQRQLIMYQRPDRDLPQIGEVYAITNLPDESHIQYFRVTDMSNQVRTFTDTTTGSPIDFQAMVVTLTISEPLAETFQGSQPTRLFTPAANTSHVRTTVFSDSTQYCGCHPLTADAAIGDLSIDLDAVFTQLVPSSTSETPLTNLAPTGAVTFVPGNSVPVAIRLVGTGGQWTIAGNQIQLPMSVMPGSVAINSVGLAPVQSLFDDGSGNLCFGSLAGDVYANIDYRTGAITIAKSTSLFDGTITQDVTFVPAAAVSKTADTFQFPITQSTRGYIYTRTVNPPPQPGATSFSFLSLGRWYTLLDDGSGKLTGATGVGVGSVNFLTGEITVSLGALPDLKSSAILAWGGATEYEIHVGDIAIKNPVIAGTLPIGSCKPGSMTVTWHAATVLKTATDDGAGNFTGDATGRLVYGNGTFELRPTVLPDVSTTFAFAFQSATTHTETYNPSKSGASVTITAAHAPVRPKSILITYQQTVVADGLTISTTQQLADDGAGNLADAAGNIKAGAVVDYTSGAITFNPDFTMITPTLDYASFTNQVPARTVDPDAGYFASIAQFGKWPVGVSSGSETFGFVNGTAVTLQYKEDAASDTAQTYSLPQPPLSVDLTPTVFNPIVPGGLAFELGIYLYVDRAGFLYRYVANAVNGAAQLAGSVNYQTGIATIALWQAGASNAITLLSLATEVQPIPVTLISSRTPGAPLRPASFFIQANKLDGTLISATADNNGNIATSAMHGYVDTLTGVYSVAFGQYVLDSSLTTDEKAQPWYDAGAIDGSGYIFKPAPVVGSTIRYNAVAQVTLSLPSAIVGIDSVRLPPDGRVQDVRPGNVGILHDSLVMTLANPLTAGQTQTLPRTNLESVVIRDQTQAVVPGQIAGGDTVSGAKYTVDLVTGVITMANPLDLSAYTQPLVATHRIADSLLVTSVEITGRITVAQPLTHAYTADNSRFSTALIAPTVGGNVQAGVSNVFSQQTWSSSAPNWTDAIVGSPTTSQLDDLTYPIAVNNRDAVTEKWALIFDGATTFKIVGKDFGVVGTGTTSSDVAPINPGTSNPYFVLDHRAFGLGWAIGNAIRFDTAGAGFPVWLGRTIKSGPATHTDDYFRLQSRWDKD